MDVVTVLRKDGTKEAVDVSILPEDKRLEYFAAKQFLEIYNRKNRTSFRIELLQDAPDVVCAQGNETLDIEVTTVFDYRTDAPKILGRAEGLGRAREIGAAISEINRVINSKSTKNYGSENCILLLRHGVPIFTGVDFRQRIGNFIVPKTHSFKEIYLLAHRDENGTMHVGKDLIRLFPQEVTD
jgi:hypothetical protein